MTRNGVKLSIAAFLILVGALEHAVRRGSVGLACIVFGLALVGIVLQDRLSVRDDEEPRRPIRR